MGHPNVAFSDKWKLSVSNIPTVSNVKDLSLYDNYVRAFSFPSLDLQLLDSNFRNTRVYHPISRDNTPFNVFRVTFKVSEGMVNYWNIWTWIKNLRHGTKSTSKELFREDWIESFRLTMLDNENRDCAIFDFKDCFVTNISEMVLVNGRSDELEFSIDVDYLKVDYELVSDIG
jgi:hypothetical protein